MGRSENEHHRTDTEKHFTLSRRSRTLRPAFPPMTWYYAKEGAPVGPISDEELVSRLRDGTVLPTTLVWRTGLADWQAASSVMNEVTARAAEAALTATPPPEEVPPWAQPSSPAPPVLPFFFCTCCGAVIPADQLVRINGRAVCASCKPGFLQKVQEGVVAPLKAPVLDAASAAIAGRFAPAAEPMPYAGFWIRALAVVVDVVVLSMVNVGMHMATGQSFTEALGLDGMDWSTRDTLLFGMDNLVDLIYETLMVARFGGTLGKLLCRIRVVTASGERLGYGHALLRALAQWVSLLLCGMGFVLAAFDRQKRALHDFMCNTRVIWAK
jgi:uncharacterized RDD family membrane protein YckC